MISKFSRLEKISSQELSREWDALALERHHQIGEGLDITFNYVMVPLIESLVGKNLSAALIDIGSGTGQLTQHLAEGFKRVVCIERSTRSIEIARSVLSKYSNVYFINSDFENCPETLFGRPDDKKIFLAAMVLSTTPNLENFVQKLAEVGHTGDEFVATIPHPRFWPKYCGYEREPWFSYQKEVIVNAPFKISLSLTHFTATHIHRPVEMYISTFLAHGFNLIDIFEPIPSMDIQSLYPSKWEYPRFIAFKWVKQ